MSAPHASISFSLVQPRFGFSHSQALKRMSLVITLLLGCFLRFYHLDGYGLWSDEFVTLMIVSKTSWLELIRTCFEIPQPMPPLYFLLDRLFVVFLGPSEISLRLFSALSSTLVLYFVFAIGRILFDFEVGVFAALLCAVNSTQIVYAQNARPYAFCLLLSTISILSFLKWTRSETRLCRLSFVVFTTLLLYAHYIFFLVLLIQNLYFCWLCRSQTQPRNQAVSPRSWKSWLSLQLCVGILVMPLAPQVWAIFRSRQTLNWAGGLVQYYPRYESFFFFLYPRPLFFSLALTLTILGVGLYLKGVLRQSDIPRRLTTAPPFKEGILSSFSGASPKAAWIAPAQTCGPSASQSSLIFPMLWYLVPLGLFFGLARAHLIHLFVERYLILTSLATYLLLSSIALYLLPKTTGRAFLIVYLLMYVVAEPGNYFLHKGQFSLGVPGGNEWRETLAHLDNPMFNAPLFLFQSPFIESNQLNFDSNTKLVEYLSTPLRSFYLTDRRRPFELLPVHWWIDTESPSAIQNEGQEATAAPSRVHTPFNRRILDLLQALDGPRDFCRLSD